MRLAKFGLEVEPTKTKVMEFGKFAVQNAKQEERGPQPSILAAPTYLLAFEERQQCTVFSFQGLSAVTFFSKSLSSPF